MVILDLLDKYMIDYSMYCIYHRAIPYLGDGLKPSQRMVMEICKDITRLTKSNTVCGKVQLIHPHGSQYDTLVNMVQKDGNNIPMIEGKGSFSYFTSRDLTAAADRYTEVKINKFGKEITGNKDELSFMPSYDGREMIPVSFSPDFPLILLNGQKGVAVGFSTLIPQYNLSEVCNQTINILKGKKYTHIFPDFSTGGYIDKVEVEDGEKMKYTIKGKYEIDGLNVLIKEIPYYTSREEIIEKIEELALSGVMKEVKDVEDLTDKNGLLIEIQLKRGTNVDEFIDKLHSLTTFQTTFTTNIGYIDGEKLVYSGIEELLSRWIDIKRKAVLEGTTKKIEKIEEKLIIADALSKTVDSLDYICDFIRKTEEDKIVGKLMEEYGIAEKGAIYLSELGIKYFRESFFYKKIDEVANLRKQMDELLAIVKDNATNELVRRLERIKKEYGTPRKTEVVEFKERKVVKIKDIETYKGYVYVTEKGFIYKTNVKTINLTPGDKIITTEYVREGGEVLIFDSKGDCNKFYLEDIDNCGKNIGYYTGIDDLVGAVVIQEETKSLLFIYEDARVCHIDVEKYRTTTKRKKLADSLYMDAKLLYCTPVIDDIEITLKTKRITKVINSKDFMVKKTRNTRGVQVLKSQILEVK